MIERKCHQLRKISGLIAMCGIALVSNTVNANSVEGSWSSVIAWPHIAVSAAAMSDGRILTWASNEKISFPVEDQFTHAALYNPGNGTFQTVNNPQHDMFCAGVSLLPNGNVLASGGNPQLQITSEFSSTGNNWSSRPLMNRERWYGTNLTMSNGEVFSSFAKGANEVPEIYTAGSGWSELPGANMDPLRIEQDLVNANAVNQATTAQWFAFMHAAPDGRVFHAGPTKTMHWFNANGTGSRQSAGLRNGETRTRQFGSAVMYNTGKLLITGGADKSRNPASTSSALTIDINGATPVVTSTASMSASRTNHNSVILANGEILVVGGESSGRLFYDGQSVLDSEIWNPTTGLWRTVDAISVPRNYHSLALLMKDARVLSAGGGLCGNCAANHQDAQIYTPPYLFNSNGSLRSRPVINNAPANLLAGQSFSVSTNQPLSALNLIRISGVTHSVNTDQRISRLALNSVGNNSYQTSLTSNQNVLIPGEYWMFAIDNNGTPSVGKSLSIGVGVFQNSPPTVTNPGNQTGQIDQSVSLSISASDPDGDSLSFSATGLPAGLSINSSGVISGTLTTAQTTSVSVFVSDSQDTTTEQFSWTVQGVSQDPVINPDSSASGNLQQGQWKYYRLPAGAGTGALIATLGNLNTDLDLYVRAGSRPTLNTYDCRSYSSGTAIEVCDINATGVQDVYIGVYAYQAGSYTLDLTDFESTGNLSIEPGDSISSGVTLGQWKFYAVSNPDEFASADVTLTGLNQDADLYVRIGGQPNLESYTCRSYNGGPDNESCTVSLGTGPVTIGVYGYRAANYTLTVTGNGGGTGGGTDGGGTDGGGTDGGGTDGGGTDGGGTDGGGNGTISTGETITDSLAQGQWMYLSVNNPDALNNAIATLSGLSTDLDLYVRTGSVPTLNNYDCRSYAAGTTTESCGLSLANGTLYIGVYAYEAGSFTLAVSGGATVTAIDPSTTRTRSIDQGEWHYYEVLDTLGVASLNARLTDLSDDIDLYVSNDTLPSLTFFDCRSYVSGTTNELCNVDMSSGEALLGVYGYAPGNYTLSFDVQAQNDNRKLSVKANITKDMALKVEPGSTPLVSTGSGAGASFGLLFPMLALWWRRHRKLIS